MSERSPGDRRVTVTANPESPAVEKKPWRFSQKWARPSGSFGAVLQSIVTKLFIVGLNAATGIIAARVLRPEGRGEMAAMIMGAGILASMMTLGIPSALVYNLRLRPERTRQYVGTGLTIAGLLGVLTALMGWLLVPVWLAHYSADVRRAASWFLISSPIPILLASGRATLEARGDFTGSNATLWLNPFLTLASLIALAATKHLTVLTAGLSYVLAGIPVFVWLFQRIWTSIGVARPDREAARELLSYGVRSYGIDLLGALAMQADQVLVVGFLNAAAMGVYAVATSLARILSVFQLSVVMVLFPRTAAREPDEVIAVTGRAVRVTTMFAIAAAPLALLFGPYFLVLLYGPAYRGAGALLSILVIEVLLSGNTQILCQSFMALGRPGVAAIVQAAGVGVSLLLMVILIPRFGVLGAGMALASSSLLRLCVTMFCFPTF